MKTTYKRINKQTIQEYFLIKEISNFHDSELIKITDLNNHSIYIPKISIIEKAHAIWTVEPAYAISKTVLRNLFATNFCSGISLPF